MTGKERMCGVSPPLLKLEVYRMKEVQTMLSYYHNIMILEAQTHFFVEFWFAKNTNAR